MMVMMCPVTEWMRGGGGGGNKMNGVSFLPNGTQQQSSVSWRNNKPDNNNEYEANLTGW